MPANSGLDQAAKSLSDIYRHAGKTASSTEEQQIVISRRFLKWLAMPLVDQMGISQTTETPLTMLDLACGSGVVTQEVQDILPGKVLGKSRFMAGDSSEALIELVRKRIAVEGWVNTEAQGLDAMVCHRIHHQWYGIIAYVHLPRRLVFQIIHSAMFLLPWVFI